MVLGSVGGMLYYRLFPRGPMFGLTVIAALLSGLLFVKEKVFAPKTANRETNQPTNDDEDDLFDEDCVDSVVSGTSEEARSRHKTQPMKPSRAVTVEVEAL